MATLCAIIRDHSQWWIKFKLEKCLKIISISSSPSLSLLYNFWWNAFHFIYTLSRARAIGWFDSYHFGWPWSIAICSNETTFKFNSFIPFITASLFSVETCLADWFVTTYCGWSHGNYLHTASVHKTPWNACTWTWPISWIYAVGEKLIGMCCECENTKVSHGKRNNVIEVAANGALEFHVTYFGSFDVLQWPCVKDVVFSSNASLHTTGLPFLNVYLFSFHRQ